MTPYYDQGGITLYHADNRDVLPTLSGVDLVFTSPPYNLGSSPSGNGAWYTPSRGGRSATKWAGFSGYGTHDDAMPVDSYVAWQTQVLRWCWDALSERGAVFYNHKPRLVHGGLWVPTVLGAGLPLRQIIVWDGGPSVGLGDRHFCPNVEWLLFYAKPGFALRDRAASARGDLWRVAAERERYGHPAPFPVALPATAIDACAPELVVDPHAGIGSTLLAAKAAGCRAIGVEVEERYCEVAARRLGQGVLPLFEKAGG